MFVATALMKPANLILFLQKESRMVEDASLKYGRTGLARLCVLQPSTGLTCRLCS